MTGKGVTIAVIDSGTSISTPEFAGRISSDSMGFEQRIARCAMCPGDTVARFPIADQNGHGTAVASVAAAAREGPGVLGMAPGATILALKVTGADFEGVTAGSTTPIPESSLPNAASIAPALLKEQWPQLGGRTISRILLDTATDMGAVGVDAVYGVGLLNFERALQAQAPAGSFVAAQTTLARYASLDVSAPFGGTSVAAAIGSRMSSMTVLDRYGPNYVMSVPSAVSVRPSGLLAGGPAGFGAAPATCHASIPASGLGFATPSMVGPWQVPITAGPAMVSFSPSPGHMMTVGTDVAVGGSQASTLAGSYLHGAVGQPRRSGSGAMRRRGYLGLGQYWSRRCFTVAWRESNYPVVRRSAARRLRTASMRSVSPVESSARHLPSRVGMPCAVAWQPSACPSRFGSSGRRYRCWCRSSSI